MDVERLLQDLEDHGHDPRLVSGQSQILVVHDACGDAQGHLYISAEHGGFICHHCQMHGNLADVLNELCDMEPFAAWKEARAILYTGDEERQYIRARKPKPMQPVSLPKEFIPDDGTGIAGEYLERRGFDRSLCGQYGIGYCLRGEYGYRVIFPVYTRGELRTFIARSWGAVEPKVLTAKGSKTSLALFNIDNVPPPTCVLVEGVFDALKMPEIAIATLGTSSSQEQREILRDLGFRELVLMRDADQAGEDAVTREAFELNAALFGVSIARLPAGKDPAECSLDELIEALDSRTDVLVSYCRRCIE